MVKLQTSLGRYFLSSVNSKVLFRVSVCAKDRRDIVIERDLKKKGSRKESTVDRKERKWLVR
jgi:hypothetical protein